MCVKVGAAPAARRDVADTKSSQRHGFIGSSGESCLSASSTTVLISLVHEASEPPSFDVTTNNDRSRPARDRGEKTPTRCGLFRISLAWRRNVRNGAPRHCDCTVDRHDYSMAIRGAFTVCRSTTRRSSPRPSAATLRRQTRRGGAGPSSGRRPGRFRSRAGPWRSDGRVRGPQAWNAWASGAGHGSHRQWRVYA